MALSELRVVRDATCLACGCLCDDIELSIAGGEIQTARNACDLGAAWFRTPHDDKRAPAILCGDIGIEFATAVDLAADYLFKARRPLISGLRASTCEALRAAIALADDIGAIVDPISADIAAGRAYQNTGAVRCSLGEVRNRADFVLFWNGDPQATHPRHRERYSVDPQGLFVPKGRPDRTVVTFRNNNDSATFENTADLVLQRMPGCDFELLWTLRALVKGVVPQFSADDIGMSLAELEDLVNRMKTCRFGVIFYGAKLSADPGGRGNVEALVKLVQELNAFTRFYAVPLGGPGNPTGAENVLAWQTGYPFAVDLGRGSPRYSPGEFTAEELLARGEVDTALLVGTDWVAVLPQKTREHLLRIPVIALEPSAPPHYYAPTISFTTATPGLHTSGSVFRVDGVALPLRPVLQSRYPSEEQALRAIHGKLKSLR
jgi:formylmethanofuran dehydrogenase subunit B